ncbi:MAG: hypothetical protein KG003_07620 [Bacteroidetes bacterium]|nr:hypothetical protein [Bacteroidota bacterium]
MSFNLSFTGSKKGVLKAIEDAPDNGQPQVPEVKALLKSEVEQMPENSYNNGISITASGHADNQNRYMNIEIRMVKLSMEE